MRAAFIALVLLLSGCGGADCAAPGTRAFTAHATQPDSRGPCAALPASFPVRLTETASGAATTWTVNEGGADHPADFASHQSCQARVSWFDTSTTPALVHDYELHADGTGELSIAQLGVCVAFYDLR